MANLCPPPQVNLCKPVKCNPCKLDCVAESLVKRAVCLATNLLDSDPAEVFFYKCPKPCVARLDGTAPIAAEAGADDMLPTTTMDSGSDHNSDNQSIGSGNDDKSTVEAAYADIEEQENETNTKEEECQQELIDWVHIEDFNKHTVISQITDYIAMWQLSPATKYVLLPLKTQMEFPSKGTLHLVDVHFSKPTPSCPNPLAVAAVHFSVHVPEMLPPHYPVMVTYRFEGYRTMFYALGKRSMRSLSFQRYFIDSILKMKLAFYTQLCECRHPDIFAQPTKNAATETLPSGELNASEVRVDTEKMETIVNVNEYI